MAGRRRLQRSTAEMIEPREIREIISPASTTRALDILKSKQDILEKGAQLLLEKEKIDGEEIQKR